MSEELNKAKDALLRALDQLEKAREDLGSEPERVDLVVVYDIGYSEGNGRWHHVGGWTSTPGPAWVHEKLLDEAAFSVADVSRPADEESSDDPPAP